MLSAGPVTCSVKFGCAAGIPEAMTARRRGVSIEVGALAAGRRSRSSSLVTRSRSSVEAASIMRAGISSVPISSKKSGMCDLTRGFRLQLLFLLLIHASLRYSHRQRPHTRDHAHALGYGNRAASVQNIEQVRALQA